MKQVLGERGGETDRSGEGGERSEERPVGKVCERTCNSAWSMSVA